MTHAAEAFASSHTRAYACHLQSNINASNMDADPMAPGSTLSRCLGE